MDLQTRIGLGVVLGGVITYLALILNELKVIAGALQGILRRLNESPPPPPGL